MVTVVIRLIPFSMDLFIGMEMGKDSKPFGTAFSVSRLRLVAMGGLGSWNGNGRKWKRQWKRERFGFQTGWLLPTWHGKSTDFKI
jgi:hypothetical protein